MVLLNGLLLWGLGKSHITWGRLVGDWSSGIVARVHWLNTAWCKLLFQSSHLGCHVHGRLLITCEPTCVIILLRISSVMNPLRFLNLNWIHFESWGIGRVTNTILSREGSWGCHVLSALLSYDRGSSLFLVIETVSKFFEEVTSLSFLLGI